ncbi:MAG TPA: FAD-binding oxidoreductase [Gemmataceae bacterium]|jgi:glycolate oxidase FAD binding subunit|nr:FAD-binding oxidoreductase [Gemmataceae bacterium]
MIDDFTPQSMHRPSNVAVLGDLIRRASAEGLALYPFGGGTMQHLGYTPTKPGLGIHMRAFDQVIDYPARDMTITVQAGITIAKLQEALAKENQRLPVDVPMPEAATLGGAIAVNASGPRRYGYGTLRDYVIGISFMNDEGQEVKAGGRVVKNVAGYDICKLQIGTLGTLGIITQVTLKVKPKPEACAAIALVWPQGTIANLLDGLHASQTRPVCVEIMSPTMIGAANYQLLIGYEDSHDAVVWQTRQLERELHSECPFLVRSGDDAQGVLAQLNSDPSEKAELGLKANLLPSELPEFLQQLAGQSRLTWKAHAGNGIVSGHFADGLTFPEARDILASLRQFAVQHHGNLVIARCPAEWKRELPIWGEPRGDWALMKKVKHEIDPKNLFNPGRFVVG